MSVPPCCAAALSEKFRLFLFVPLAAIFVAVTGCTSPSTDAAPAPVVDEEQAPATPTTPDASVVWPTSYTPPSTFVDAKLQVGPWVPTPANVEEPFINIVHASGISWQNDDWSAEELFDAGHIDPNTGMLTSFPAGVTSLYTTVFFTAGDKSFYHGDWVLEWDGDATMEMEFVADELERPVGANRVEFTRSEETPFHARIRVTRLGPGGITGLRLFRASNEAALDAGQIYSAAFVENVRRADVVRTMDLQEANRAYIHRLDQVAPMTEYFWNNYGVGSASFAPHRSMPLEAVAALGVEADVEIWHHAPMELGVPVDFTDPSIFSDNLETWSVNVANMTAANITAILASPEWDNYADAFVAALASAGYPESRPLYTTLSNEVWNFALQYHLSTRYAWAAGEAYGGSSWSYRHGYGVFMGRWMLALEAALTRAGRNQNVVYVVEGQAANLDTTRQALTGMQTYIEDEGRTWTDFTAKIGVSVASYWGGRGYYHFFEDLDGATLEALHARFASEIANDPVDFARRFADFYLNGPDDVIASKAWVLKRFEEHNAVSADFGVTVIGAYEGGSHDDAPEFFRETYGPSSELLFDWYENYMWGTQGARVNNDINDALAVAYPGIILSNYVTVGPTGGQPWFDGAEGENLPMQVSWTKYHRP